MRSREWMIRRCNSERRCWICFPESEDLLTVLGKTFPDRDPADVLETWAGYSQQAQLRPLPAGPEGETREAGIEFDSVHELQSLTP
jgi:hypothetical protein